MTSEQLHTFCNDLIHGTGGFHSFEEHEVYAPADRDVAIVEWTIRCLANDRNEQSWDAIQTIAERHLKQTDNEVQS